MEPHSVIVASTGLVGLLAVLTLARRGIKVTVLDILDRLGLFGVAPPQAERAESVQYRTPDPRVHFDSAVPATQTQTGETVPRVRRGGAESGLRARFLIGTDGAVSDLIATMRLLPRILGKERYRTGRCPESRMQQGRIVLASNSAHITNTRDGMSMKTGIHDPWMLTHAIARVPAIGRRQARQRGMNRLAALPTKP